MAKSSFSEFKERLTSETVYFKYDFEQAVIRSVPGKGFFVKLKGSDEFKAKDGSKLVTDAILEHKEISEDQYYDF